MSFQRPSYPSTVGVKDPKAKRLLSKLREAAQIAEGSRGEREARFLTAEDVDERFESINKFIAGQGDNFKLSDKAIDAVDTPNIKKGAISSSAQNYMPAGLTLNATFRTLASASLDHVSGNGIEIRPSCFFHLGIAAASNLSAHIEVRITRGADVVWGPHNVCDSVALVLNVPTISNSTFSFAWLHIPPVGGNTYDLQARVVGAASAVAYGRCIILREDKI